MGCGCKSNQNGQKTQQQQEKQQALENLLKKTIAKHYKKNK
jgi:hypothetical protein